jgi:hypothetical protein
VLPTEVTGRTNPLPTMIQGVAELKGQKVVKLLAYRVVWSNYQRRLIVLIMRGYNIYGDDTLSETLRATLHDRQHYNTT